MACKLVIRSYYLLLKKTAYLQRMDIQNTFSVPNSVSEIQTVNDKLRNQ